MDLGNPLNTYRILNGGIKIGLDEIDPLIAMRNHFNPVQALAVRKWLRLVKTSCMFIN